MKMSSNNIVKICVIAVCVIFMCFVCWKLYRDYIAINADDAIDWPPEINKCPDYWTYKSDGMCHNSDGTATMDPLIGPIDKEGKALIAKCGSIDVPWEGIDHLC
tara:strand:+ start:332 stop:643 length:312 start_codon:yes stop_codon:yes gene_type:complete